ncbi:unannotated protein [freshwater metagenome]|uniref:Unannotated protein n=1 Tax=freshwater metagenome TaxID=449393 RepID=A0A6J6PM28_9ZZZZ
MTAAAQTVLTGTSTADPSVVSWGSPTVSPPPGSGNTFTGDVFTVAQAGLYQITVQLVTAQTSYLVPNIQVGGAYNDGDDFYGIGTINNQTAQVPHKGRGQISATTYLNAGDTFRIRVENASTVVSLPVSTDGSSRLTVVKLS